MSRRTVSLCACMVSSVRFGCLSTFSNLVSYLPFSLDLDMEAVIWLEDYLSKWDKILLLISHSQDFLNNVTTHTIHFTNKRKLEYYDGNYDQFVKTKSELEENQMKQYNWEQDQIKSMKEYIARFGHGTSKNAKQAQSKQKVLDKMVRGGLVTKPEVEKPMNFKFPDPGHLPPPVLAFHDVSFGYPNCEPLYTNVNFGVDLDSRVALVGPNGAGKVSLNCIVVLMCTLNDNEELEQPKQSTWWGDLPTRLHISEPSSTLKPVLTELRLLLRCSYLDSRPNNRQLWSNSCLENSNHLSVTFVLTAISKSGVSLSTLWTSSTWNKPHLNSLIPSILVRLARSSESTSDVSVSRARCRYRSWRSLVMGKSLVLSLPSWAETLLIFFFWMSLQISKLSSVWYW
jgi:hypothetical protein